MLLKEAAELPAVVAEAGVVLVAEHVSKDVEVHLELAHAVLADEGARLVLEFDGGSWRIAKLGIGKLELDAGRRVEPVVGLVEGEREDRSVEGHKSVHERGGVGEGDGGASERKVATNGEVELRNAGCSSAEVLEVTGRVERVDEIVGTSRQASIGCIAAVDRRELGESVDLVGVSADDVDDRYFKHARVLAQTLDPLVSPRDNYKIYRDHVKSRREAGESCIPFLPVYQRDLTIAEDANPDRLPDRTINVDKMLLIGKILAELAHFQKQPALEEEMKRYESSNNTAPVLKQLQILPCREESALEALSEQLRPRARTEDESSSTGSSFFHLDTITTDSSADSASDIDLTEV